MKAIEAIGLRDALASVFFLVRIVDPEKREVCDMDGDGVFRPTDTCYNVWHKDSPCEHCNTRESCRNRITSDKYEMMDGEVYHITSKPIEIDEKKYALELVMKIDAATDLRRREILVKEQEKNMEVIRILASEYSSVYYIRLDTQEINSYTMNDLTRSEFGSVFTAGIGYTDAFRLYVKRFVHPTQQSMILHAGSIENIREQLKDQKSFVQRYRSADGGYCEMKFVKVDEEDQAPTAVALAFADCDEDVRLEQINERNREIIQTLAGEYSSVYYVDLVRGEMTVTKQGGSYIFEDDNGATSNVSFSRAIETYLEKSVHSGDREKLRQLNSPEYIRELLSRQNIVRLTFRVGTENDYRYNELKIVKVNAEGEAQAVVLGIADKDEEIRAALQEEIIRRRNTEIIEILASEYTSVYYIDLETDELTPYTMNEETEHQFGVLFKNLHYSEAYRMYVNTLVFPDDRRMMIRAGSVGSIIKELKTKKTYITRYRSSDNRYCEMKFVKVGKENGTPTAVALGFADKDEELRHGIEEEIVRRRNTEIIEILASEYTSVYYIDLMTDDLSTYTMNAETESEFGQVFRGGIKYTEAFRMYVGTMVYAEDRVKMLRAGSIYNILAELHDKKSFTTTYRAGSADDIHYCEMKFVKVGDEEDPHAVALGFSVVDEAYKQALENRRRESFISGLADDYEAVFHVDRDRAVIDFVRVTPTFLARNPGLREHMDYETFLDVFAYNILPEDLEVFKGLLGFESIDSEFSSASTFFRNYAITTDEGVSYRQMKIVRIGDWKTEHDFLIGVNDVDEATRTQMEQEAAMRQARREAESANRAKSTFLFNMSHDIRTPMNAILGFNGMALKHIDDPAKLRDYLGKVNTSSEHLLSIINDVLDMARIESGKVTIDEQPARVREAAEELVSIVQQSVRDKGLTLITDFDRIRHNNIYADKLRVNRVLMNIITNAIKYTKSGGRVSYTIIETEPVKPGCASYDFIIEDNGIGMSEEFLKHVFEAFTRETSTTVSGIQGTGLGMAITKELVELMHGTIRIESKAGQGTKVSIHFDFKIAEDVKDESDAREEADVSVLKGKRVLLVEDNELNREIAVELLEELGMVVTQAVDGTYAVELCRETALKGPESYFDFILMDIQMPIMNGYAATEAIRAIPTQDYCHVPIIAMTANAFAEDKQRAFDAGMDAHVAKPINIAELIRKLVGFVK